MNLPPQQPLDSWRSLLGAAGVGLTFGVLTGAGSWALSGLTLGLFLGPLALSAVAVAPLALAEPSAWRRAFAWAALCDGVSATWLAAAAWGPVTLRQWLLCTLVLTAFTALVAVMAAALNRLRLHPAPAAAVPTALALAWLTWPIWTAPWLLDRGGKQLVQPMVDVHPLFAVNAVLRSPDPLLDFGVWAQFPLAYNLTSIGDDIAYRLPRSILPCLLLHGLSAGLILAAGGLADRLASRGPGEWPRECPQNGAPAGQ